MNRTYHLLRKEANVFEKMWIIFGYRSYLHSPSRLGQRKTGYAIVFLLSLALTERSCCFSHRHLVICVPRNSLECWFNSRRNSLNFPYTGPDWEVVYFKYTYLWLPYRLQPTLEIYLMQAHDMHAINTWKSFYHGRLGHSMWHLWKWREKIVIWK